MSISFQGSTGLKVRVLEFWGLQKDGYFMGFASGSFKSILWLRFLQSLYGGGGWLHKRFRHLWLGV